MSIYTQNSPMGRAPITYANQRRIQLYRIYRNNEYYSG